MSPDSTPWFEDQSAAQERFLSLLLRSGRSSGTWPLVAERGGRTEDIVQQTVLAHNDHSRHVSTANPS